MSTRQLNLIRKDYCYRRGINDVNAVTFAHQRVNRITGNQIFTVQNGEAAPVTYEHQRLDVTVFALQRSLRLPKDQSVDRDALLNKTGIATWINQYLNLEMLEEDIASLFLTREGLNVVMSPNSMRFQNAFIISFT